MTNADNAAEHALDMKYLRERQMSPDRINVFVFVYLYKQSFLLGPLQKPRKNNLLIAVDARIICEFDVGVSHAQGRARTT